MPVVGLQGLAPRANLAYPVYHISNPNTTFSNGGLGKIKSRVLAFGLTIFSRFFLKAVL